MRIGYCSRKTVRMGMWVGPGPSRCRMRCIRPIPVLSRCWLKGMMAFIGVSVTAFSSFCKIMLSGTKLLRKVVWIVNAKLGHHLLLFGRAWLSSRKRIFKDRRRLGCNWCPFMELLAEEICLIGQQDLGPFNFAQVETLRGHLLGSGHHWISIRTHKVSKVLSRGDDILEYVFFIGLERKIVYVILPVLQLFKLGTSCIAWNFDAPITNWTRVFVIFLHFTASYLETLAMVPDWNGQTWIEEDTTKDNCLPFMTQLALNHHTSLRLTTHTEYISCGPDILDLLRISWSVFS